MKEPILESEINNRTCTCTTEEFSQYDLYISET